MHVLVQDQHGDVVGRFFAQAEDGRFYVPEGKRDLGKLYAKVGTTVNDTCVEMAAWLATFAEGIAPFDDQHKRLKKEVADPLFAGVLLKKALDNLDPNDVDSALKRYRDGAEEIKARIPEVFQNTPQGKILSDKAADGIAEKFAELDKARSKARVLRGPARQLSERLREGDEFTADFLVQSTTYLPFSTGIAANVITGQANPNYAGTSNPLTLAPDSSRAARSTTRARNRIWPSNPGATPRKSAVSRTLQPRS